MNDPAPATTETLFMLVSLVPTVQMITLDVVTKELVTTSDVAPAAKLTLPDDLLIVCAPVVPVAVMVLVN